MARLGNSAGRKDIVINGIVRVKGQEGSIILWEPCIEVAVAGVSREFLTVTATVDTGFTGMLALPGDIIRELDLTRHGVREVDLAHGRLTLPIYGAVVSWLGRELAATVHQVDGDPLAGNALLTGCRLTVDFRSGGSVLIAPLPPDAPTL